MSCKRSHSGFTLVELAIAIFIIALLLGSILVPLTTQVEQRQITETQKTMEEIRDALLGFAATNGYLPCPDLQVRGLAPNDGLIPAPNDGIQDPNDGIEDVTTAGVIGVCTTITGLAPNQLAAGNLPWGTLGLGNQDVWGNRFRYTVLAAYAQRPVPPALLPQTFSLQTLGGLRVCTTTATCLPATTMLTSTAVAVIISHGKNGYSAINALTNAANVAATSADELENANNDRDAISRTQSNVAGNEFDDIVIWLPKFTLNNRMVSAGRLP